MANIGIVYVPDNKEWIKQLKSSPVIRATGPSQVTTNRGIVSFLRIRKKKII